MINQTLIIIPAELTIFFDFNKIPTNDEAIQPRLGLLSSKVNR